MRALHVHSDCENYVIMQVISDAVETMIESLVEFAPNSPHE